MDNDCTQISATKRELFFSFLKIGMFTFGGGYAMIPIIKQEVITRRNWVANDEFLELLTLAQSVPGPISLNTAAFVGYRLRGLRGALSGVAGVVLPSFVIILIIAIFFRTFKDNRWVAAAFNGMRPAVVALIISPVFSLAKGMGYLKWLVAGLTAVLVWYFHISPIYIIILGALAGVAIALNNSRKIAEK